MKELADYDVAESIERKIGTKDTTWLLAMDDLMDRGYSFRQAEEMLERGER